MLTEINSNSSSIIKLANGHFSLRKTETSSPTQCEHLQESNYTTDLQNPYGKGLEQICSEEKDKFRLMEELEYTNKVYRGLIAENRILTLHMEEIRRKEDLVKHELTCLVEYYIRNH